MSTMTTLAISVCIGLSGAQQQACEKAIEAGAKQSGIEQNVDRFQRKIEKNATDKATDIIGKPGVDVVGGGVFVAKTIMDKSVRFNLPTLGICDRITNQIGVNQYSTQLEWGF